MSQYKYAKYTVLKSSTLARIKKYLTAKQVELNFGIICSM